ncbi:hypothetical protein K3722_04450 [Leisingera caerulea]|uniref:ATP-grasp fold RimK-type domain-containing protein n=1 Tax=Leisingera caerulea TaxID=506591 RepID=A0ABY5WYK7_LEICA|nr:hypothetical protein [Leisingera caerulea]UWQ59382.1 hypothetical protein K3722_04450 [Leisingera caerulea]
MHNPVEFCLRRNNHACTRAATQEREAGATAIRAAKTKGLNACGVDMLRASYGAVVMAVNSSPGLEGVEKATSLDITGRMIEFLEKHAKSGVTRSKDKG